MKYFSIVVISTLSFHCNFVFAQSAGGSDQGGWTVFLPSFLFIALVIALFVKLNSKKFWARKHPLSLQDYLSKHPDANTGHGIKCKLCGSKSLKNIGLTNASDPRRLISCNSCGTPLYHVEQ